MGFHIVIFLYNLYLCSSLSKFILRKFIALKVKTSSFIAAAHSYTSYPRPYNEQFSFPFGEKARGTTFCFFCKIGRRFRFTRRPPIWYLVGPVSGSRHLRNSLH